MAHKLYCRCLSTDTRLITWPYLSLLKNCSTLLTTTHNQTLQTIALKRVARNFLQRCIAFELQIHNDSIGIRLKSPVDLGKKLIVAILSVIVYCFEMTLQYLLCFDKGLGRKTQSTSIFHLKHVDLRALQ